MNRTARHTAPLPVAELQTTVDLSTRRAGPAACVPTADTYQVDALPAALVLKNGIEPADARIRDAVSKMVVPEHALHVQVLDANGAHLAVVRQLMSDLVNIVEPLVGYFRVNAGYMMLNLFPVGRTLRLMSQFPLIVLQTLLCCLCKVRSSELSTIRTDGKRLDTGINADSSGYLDLAAGLLADCSIHQDGSIVLPVSVHRDRHILDLSVEASVKHYRDILALRYAESPALPVDGAVLRIVERLPVLLPLGQRMIRSMLPPVLEGVSNLLDSVLKRLGIDLAEPWINLLQGDKLSLCSIEVYTDTCSAPHHRHIVERAVVCHAAAAEALREELRLFRSRIKPVFVSSQHSTNILILCSAVKQKKHQNEQIQCFGTLDIQCGISHRILAKVPIQPAALPCGGKTEDSAPAECCRTWNIHSVYGSDAGSRAPLHSCKTCGISTTARLPSERKLLVSHAEGIRIPAEISVTMDTVLLRGDRRTYIGKHRGELYRTSKNKFQRPFISRLKPGRIPACSHKWELLAKLQELFIARDAYWKLYGEEMNLGKPWEPEDENTFSIFYDRLTDEISRQDGYNGANSTFEFPTAEIRDQFHDNFGPDLEKIKKIL